jgi:acyl-CoA synthetase (AMP-forming)/AMP-acid ligase II
MSPAIALLPSYVPGTTVPLLGEKLAHYKIPRYVLVVEEFPMTVIGKIHKVEMREKSTGILGLGDAAAIRNA